MIGIRAFGLDIYGCREALERLDDYVDHELSAEETRRVAAHLRICRECARKAAFEARLVERLRACLAQIEPAEAAPEPEKAAPESSEPDLKARIAAALARERLQSENAGE